MSNALKVNLPQLMTRVTQEIDDPIVGLGFKGAHQALLALTYRALELDDEPLLNQLEILGYVIIDDEKNTTL